MVLAVHTGCLVRISNSIWPVLLCHYVDMKRVIREIDICPNMAHEVLHDTHILSHKLFSP